MYKFYRMGSDCNYKLYNKVDVPVQNVVFMLLRNELGVVVKIRYELDTHTHIHLSNAPRLISFGFNKILYVF